MRKVVTGNQAAAEGALLARVDVVSAYPITPATQVIEAIAEMEADGRFQGKFMRVESEHSAMAALLGAATAGARTFTATSSHGLAYMHEMLHWTSGARLPIVMVEVNRALAAPWSLWNDQTDSLSQRDTGWMQLYCASNQEVLDSVLFAYRIAETVRVPAMVVLDGFILSHTYEQVDLPTRQQADAFLPPMRSDDVLDPKNPAAFGSLVQPREYMRLRRRLSYDMGLAITAFEKAADDFEKLFKRRYEPIESYRTEDADTVFVTAGASGQTAEAAVDALRAKGKKAGALRLRLFRPFPVQLLRRLVKPGQTLAVVDRSFSQGATGIFCAEVQAALYGSDKGAKVAGFVAGLGGGDITVELLREIWDEANSGAAVGPEPVWMEDAR